MAVASGLPPFMQHLAEYVKRFGATPELRGASVVFGRRELDKHLNQGVGTANRIVVALHPDGNWGRILQPRQNVGQNPRPVKDWDKRFVCAVWAVDASATNDELRQFEALEALLELAIQGLESVGKADVKTDIGGLAAAPSSGVERRYGLEARFPFSYRGRSSGPRSASRSPRRTSNRVSSGADAMLPSVRFNKVNANTGVVRPGNDGIAAVIAPASKGPQNVPSVYADANAILADYDVGTLAGWGAYLLAKTGNPVVLINPATSSPAVYGAITETSGGTAAVTAGDTAPNDDYDVLVRWIAGGTVGTPGITYTTSLDGGLTTSPVLALGAAGAIAIPRSGVSLKVGAGTILAGQTTAFAVTAARMSNADLAAALEALRTTAQRWESVLVHGDATATTVATLDTFLGALEQTGKFRTAVCNTRRKASGESESAYATALQAAFAPASSIRVVVCADASDVVSAIPGFGVTQAQYAALDVMARGMAIDVSVDAAFVALGPVGGSIADARGNPRHHDEAIFPNLDDLRVTTLRSFAQAAGAFITNPRLLSPDGSDYVFWQHARVINKACELAFQELTNQLSVGVTTQANANSPNVANIAEGDAQRIEGFVQAPLDATIVTPRRASGCRFTLSRTDDLSGNGPANVTAFLALAPLKYIKTFSVTAAFVRTLAA